MFSKKPGNPQPKPQGKTMANATFSVFGPDIRVKGDVAASADLHIDGHVEGDVSCTALVQGESGEIVGGVTAETARLSGTVRGTINVRELCAQKRADLRRCALRCADDRTRRAGRRAVCPARGDRRSVGRGFARRELNEGRSIGRLWTNGLVVSQIPSSARKALRSSLPIIVLGSVSRRTT